MKKDASRPAGQCSPGTPAAHGESHFPVRVYFRATSVAPPKSQSRPRLKLDSSVLTFRHTSVENTAPAARCHPAARAADEYARMRPAGDSTNLRENAPPQPLLPD